jgi:hypothetical protein
MKRKSSQNKQCPILEQIQPHLSAFALKPIIVNSVQLDEHHLSCL